MSTASSWRDFLRDCISNSVERDRIAKEMGISPVTLTRWVTGASNPRSQNLKQLLRALPQQQQDKFATFLKDASINFTLPDATLNETFNETEYLFIKQVFELRSVTADNLLFWTLCRMVLLQALRRLDSERLGIAVTVVQCMPPSALGFVSSLREIMGFGTPPWPGDLGNQALFLGVESLAGYVVTHFRSEIIDDLRLRSTYLPAYQVEHEVSAAAVPIMYTGLVAGCLLVSSTRAGYFRPEARLSLVKDYAQLIVLAFTPQQFYSSQQIQLQMMPSVTEQRACFATLQERITALMKEAIDTASPLSRAQAEEIVWEQIEEELLHLPNSVHSSY